jgi:hypothetical protein
MKMKPPWQTTQKNFEQLMISDPTIISKQEVLLELIERE